MIFENEKKILNIIKFTPPIFILTIGIIISIFLYFENISIYNNEKAKIQKEHLERNKELIKEKVHEIYNHILLAQQSTELKLKKRLEEELDKAHTIMTAIYKHNKDKPENEIKELIKQSLRDVRFNDGRGYFFIYNMKAKNVLLPTHPHLENKSFINHKDAQGNYIIRRMANTMKNTPKSFYEWYWYKPNNKTEQKKKIGLTKRFEPFNWFIGTGEYVEDFESEVQETLLNYIRTIRYGKSGYIFIITYDTIYLSHIRKEFWGKSAITNNDTKEIRTVIERLIKIAKDGEGYDSYIQNKKPGSDLATHKISYVKGLQNWQWMIGTGFYEDDIKEALTIAKKKIDKKFQQYIRNTIVICILMTIVLLVISLYISKLLKKRFVRYTKEIEQHITHNSKQQDILAQQSKMAAMGEMISNIAHQWRQPLSNITTASTGMRIQKELGLLNDQQFYEGIDNISKSAQHLSHTIDDFRNFFHTSKEHIQFNLNRLIEKTINLLEAQFKNKNIEIIKNIEDVSITNLENELIQVMMNLFNNARDELVKKPQEFKRFIFIDVTSTEEKVTITFKDNAGGISQDILPRIFEPYFTTKHKAQGTGIGLYMSKEIIEKHMYGTIHVENESYTYEDETFYGAKFTIELNK